MLSMSLEELLDVDVTTASQTAQKVTDAPATIYVVTKEQISLRGYVNLEDILEDIPEIEVQRKSSTQNNNTISIRGVVGNEKFIIMQDGMRINSHTGNAHAINNNFSILHAERVEVVLGPASALYGVDAFTGVINIITKDGKDLNGAEIRTAYGSFNSTEQSVIIGGGKDDFSFLASGSFYSSKEPDFPSIYKDEYAWYNDQYSQNGNMQLLSGDTITVDNTEDFQMGSKAYNISARIKCLW
jgi:outer membrane receptor for ferrienterochelin and colicin